MIPSSNLTILTHQDLPESPAVTDALLDAMTQRIVQACDPESVILFGSYAHGAPDSDSDIDLFVVMKPRDAQETSHHRIMKVRAVAKLPYLPLDVIVRTPHEVETRLAMGDFFIKDIIDRGKVLYQRDAARRVG
jgi:predicted nucleotidyltransferase